MKIVPSASPDAVVEPVPPVPPALRRGGRPKEAGLAERRRQQIIDAAIVVFPEKGYEGTSMLDLTREAGVGQGTVYRYFTGKRDILDHLFDHCVGLVIDRVKPQRMMEPAKSVDELVERFRSVGSELFDLVETNPELVKLAFVEAGAVDDELRDRVLGLERMVTGFIDRALARAAREGLIEPTRHTPFLARAILMLLIPGVVVALRGQGSADVRARYVDEIGRFLRRALRSGGPVRFTPQDVAELDLPPVGIPVGAAGPSRRTQLVRAAYDVMLDQGYQSIGVADIVAKAGVSHGTFYNYFKNKREILDAVIDLLFDSVRVSVEAIQSSPAEDIDAYARQLAGIYKLVWLTGRDDPALMNFVALTVPGVDEAAIQRLLGAFLGFSGGGTPHLANGVARGYVRADCDAAIAGEIVVASVVAVMLPHLDPSTCEPLETVVSTMVELVCNGLMPTP